jgi:hypothetical protein
MGGKQTKTHENLVEIILSDSDETFEKFDTQI